MPRKRKEQSDNYYKAFPTALRELIKEHSTTQQALADHLKKSRQAIAYYCDGSSSPDWETLVKIARYFSVSTDYLVGESPTKTPNVEIQAICKFTGLSEVSVMNLHTEAKDRDAIAALDRILSNDYADLHRLNLIIHKALLSAHNYPFGTTIQVPLADFIPDDQKSEFFAFIEEWGGEILSPKDARDYYASQAAHIFQRIVENAGHNVMHISLDEL